MKKVSQFFAICFVLTATVLGGCVNDVTSAPTPIASQPDAGPDANPCRPAEVKVGAACAPEALACNSNTCCGGRWVPDSLKDLCPKSDAGTPVVVGDSGTPPTADSGTPVPPVGSVKVTITVKAGVVDGKPADHVYVQGELVQEGDLRPAGSVTAYTSWGWLSCDSIRSSADLVCSAVIPSGMDLRYQGYVQRGSQVLYTCGTVSTTLDPATTQMSSVEGVGEVKPDFATNVAGDPYKDCQIGRKSAKK